MAKEKRKRPVVVKTKRFVPGEGSKDLTFEGLFHDWGHEAEPDDQYNFGNFTVGIVERIEDGQIFTVNPNDIRFTDKKIN